MKAERNVKTEREMKVERNVSGWRQALLRLAAAAAILLAAAPAPRAAGLTDRSDQSDKSDQSDRSDRSDQSDKSDPNKLTALKVFAFIPLEVLDMLRPSTRLDMIDYYEQADSLLSAPNALGGSSRFLQVADDYLKMQVTPVSTLEIKILPLVKKEKVIMTLYTTGSDDGAKDTDVRFFDETLRPMHPGDFIKPPKLKNFFNLKNSKVKENEIREALPFKAVWYTTGPGDTPLTARLTTLSILPQETADLLRPLLLPPLSAPWHHAYRFR